MIEIVIRVVLAGVLVGAAVAKLASPRSSRAALVTFGLGPGAAQSLAWGGLIAAELGLAAGVAAVPSLPSGEPSSDQFLGLGLAVALLACAGLGIAVLALAREVGMLRLQLGPQSALEIPQEGPPVGERLELMAAIPSGHEQPALALAIFVSDGCGVCASLKPSIEALSRDPVVAMRVFDEARNAGAWSAARAPGAPYAVAADLDGTVLAKGTFNNLAQLESVLGTAERRRGELAAVPGA